MNHNNCLICGCKTILIPLNLFDTRFGIVEEYDIGYCSQCGLLQTIPVPSYDEIKNLYDTYYNFGGEKNTLYTRLREWFLSSRIYHLWLIIDGDISFYKIRGSGRLLDIGCNEGRGLKIYQTNGFEVEGLELNATAATVARKKGFIVHTAPIEHFKPVIPYDVVVLSNVLEHSLDPKGMLLHIQQILKPTGQLWISCPNYKSWLRWIFGKHWINWHVPFHIVHYSTENLKRLMKDSGFKIMKIKQVTPALWVAQSIIVRLFSKRGKPTKQLHNPLLVGALMILVRGFLFPLLWLGNRIGHGDCLVVVARKR